MIKQDIPKIRFYSYQGAWTENKITDIVKISAGGDVDKERLKESGKYPVVANSLTNKGIVGFYDDYKVKAPAVTVTGRGDVGYAVARHENFTPIVRLLTLQSDNIDVDYLENQINSMRILNESTGVPQLTAPQLGNYKVYHPEIEEQIAIGSLFRTLDDLLASYKDNLANYQSLKATLLSKMFPKAGHTVPEIRLDGFEGEWEFSSLGEQADITKLAGFEFTNHVVYSDEGKIPAIRGLNVKNQKVNLSDVKYIDKSDFSKLDRSKLIEDDLLFTYVGTVGEVARVPESVLWYLAPNVSRIRLNRALDSRFVLYQMASNRFKQKQIFPLIATSSQPALSMANIRKFIISFTTLEEQQAIGSYFSNLDNLINSHQEKISQLETLKKKLLQDMFI